MLQKIKRYDEGTQKKDDDGFFFMMLIVLFGTAVAVVEVQVGEDFLAFLDSGGQYMISETHELFGRINSFGGEVISEGFQIQAFGGVGAIIAGVSEIVRVAGISLFTLDAGSQLLVSATHEGYIQSTNMGGEVQSSNFVLQLKAA